MARMYVKDHKSIKIVKYAEELQLPRPTSWIDPETGNVVQGFEVFPLKYESHVRPNNNHTRRGDEFDACPICHNLWTTKGTHQLCCLPCGHMYGLSCITTWLQTGSSGTQKCPLCKTLCTLKDVRLLYATRLCIPNATAAADQIVADQMASTRCFPYSSAGEYAYMDYELGRVLYAANKRFDVLKRRVDVLGQQNVAMRRQTKFLNLKAHAEKQAKSLEQRAGAMGRADALRRRADVYGQLADKYLHKADAFGRRADAYGRRAEALVQRHKRIDASVLMNWMILSTALANGNFCAGKKATVFSSESKVMRNMMSEGSKASEACQKENQVEETGADDFKADELPVEVLSGEIWLKSGNPNIPETRMNWMILSTALANGNFCAGKKATVFSSESKVMRNMISEGSKASEARQKENQVEETGADDFKADELPVEVVSEKQTSGGNTQDQEKNKGITLTDSYVE
ncbi:zinc finger, RING/FYVE/PHD-type [Artemisia annua]|uniref:Zinc finger, RING/FYVE/PHD-type n=1 Tax=Artemisia annua TaxID=35608 RepID=A0A2U1MHL3_ARTAN|nr:zinc finger, RING/FYVE/PHD-type [Artemisia annua]